MIAHGTCACSCSRNVRKGGSASTQEHPSRPPFPPSLRRGGTGAWADTHRSGRMGRGAVLAWVRLGEVARSNKVRGAATFKP